MTYIAQNVRTGFYVSKTDYGFSLNQNGNYEVFNSIDEARKAIDNCGCQYKDFIILEVYTKK